MKQFLEDEQKSRKELERIVRKLAKQKNDCAWEDCGHWKHPKTRPHCFHWCELVEGCEGLAGCICIICLMSCLHISITQSRVGPSLSDNHAWSFPASVSPERNVTLINPSSRFFLAGWDYSCASWWSSSRKVRLLKWDVYQKPPFGECHCERSASEWNNVRQAKQLLCCFLHCSWI